MRIAARELPLRSFKAFNAALIISEYFGCDEPALDLLFVDFFCCFFGEPAAAVDGADETGADVLSVIVDGKFYRRNVFIFDHSTCPLPDENCWVYLKNLCVLEMKSEKR